MRYTLFQKGFYRVMPIIVRRIDFTIVGYVDEYIFTEDMWGEDDDT